MDIRFSRNFIWFFVDGLVGSLVIGLVFGLVFGLMEYLKSDNIAIIQINQPYQRFRASMKMGHFSILQHYHLLYLLRKKGLLPYKLVDFLNAMTDRHIFEPGRATWRFRHQILQDLIGQLQFPPARGTNDDLQHG